MSYCVLCRSSLDEPAKLSFSFTEGLLKSLSQRAKSLGENQGTGFGGEIAVYNQ